MKWLNDYVDISGIAPREFAEEMTMSGSKVEGFEHEGEVLDRVVVGKVLSLEKHPDADKLLVCQIDVGAETVQIVTGAQNLTVGDYIPVALDNSTLPGGKIKKGKLRGVESFGMLCSLSELELTQNDFPTAITDGIFVLDDECKKVLGMDIRESIGLNDCKVEFEITSNRPDCLSVIGLAREAAATFSKPLMVKKPQIKGIEGSAEEYLKISIKDELCSRYCGAIVKNVRIKPSPLWLRERLRTSGVRPINNIVDITNYVMLEYGHPMHAFDYKYIEGGEINVRRAAEGEKITTLDGTERALDGSMLVIADAKKPVAVAGVMGGEYSGIMDDTQTLVFEAACFDGASVRLSAKKLGMRTDSSSRFEKGLDNSNCPPALERALELVELLDAGEVVTEYIDCAAKKSEPLKLVLDAEYTNRFLGTDISKKRMEEILASLGFEVNGDEVTVPSFRTDVAHKADIAEEIARIYGYNNIPSTVMGGSSRGKLNSKQMFKKTVSESLLALGMSEIMTYSFISPKYYDKIRLPGDSTLRNSLSISNPLGEDTSIMRTTAIPSMLEILSKNYSCRNMKASLFEIAREYVPVDGCELPLENEKILLGMYGEGCDFYTLKGVVEELLLKIGIADIDVTAEKSDTAFHQGRCAILSVGGEYLGIIGEAHPAVLDNYELGIKAYIASLDLEAIYKNRLSQKQYKPLPKFPASTRDLALVCDRDFPVLAIEKTIKASAGKLLESVSLFDIYTGDRIEEDKKSVAYSLTFRSHEETLTVEQADASMKRILKALAVLDVTIRA